jgi:pimeloyl-ACP methyl ester carboxylesterase
VFLKVRISRSCFLTLTVALLAACASAPITPPVADIAGDWYGTMKARGLDQPMLMHFTRATDGHCTGTVDLPGEVEFDLPLKSATLDGAQLSAVIVGNSAEATFTGTLDPATHQIRGQLKQDDATLPLVLRPMDSAAPSFKRLRSLFYEVDGRRVHYVQVDGPADVRVVFIHGTPGSWEGWSEYLGNPDLQRRATLIALDRPGFGESKGDVVPDLHEQARLLEPLLKGPPSAQTSGTKTAVTTIVVGHSLGGPIAAELAMDFPDRVQGALLIAPSIDPATEVPRWYNQAMTWWAVSLLVSKLMDPQLENANRELMPLAEQLKTMEPRWKSLPMPVTVIQGQKDDLVDPRTADFAERVLPPGNSVIRVPDEGHFVLWEQPQIEVQALLGLLDRSTLAGNGQAQTVR